MSRRNLFPKNVTLTEIHVGNLFHDRSLLNISILTDADPKLRFARLATNIPIEEDGTYGIYANLQCWEYMIVKVETSEGFHTK